MQNLDDTASTFIDPFPPSGEVKSNEKKRAQQEEKLHGMINWLKDEQLMSYDSPREQILP